MGKNQAAFVRTMDFNGPELQSSFCDFIFNTTVNLKETAVFSVL